MGKLASVWKIASSWYISFVVLAAVGALIGSLVFFKVYPGKPQIGIIDIPFTVISEDSAFVITAFLDYARQNDDVKAVVIKLTSPGGGAAASELLFFETRKLREKKPVVIVMNDLVASGGYMMSMGANYTYARASTFVGSVGVILTAPGPLIPSPPSEGIITTGPFKQGGGSRRDFIGLSDALKQAFIQIVVTERGDKLRISPEEIGQARIYSGVEGVRLGLVDALGGDTEAIEKAASLARISGYDLLDVNTEVFRIFNKKIFRIQQPLLPLSQGDGAQPGLADMSALMGLSRGTGGSASPVEGVLHVDMLRSLFLPSGTGESQESALPGFPLNVNPPNIYYLYVGPSH